MGGGPTTTAGGWSKGLRSKLWRRFYGALVLKPFAHGFQAVFHFITGVLPCYLHCTWCLEPVKYGTIYNINLYMYEHLLLYLYDLKIGYGVCNNMMGLAYLNISIYAPKNVIRMWVQHILTQTIIKLNNWFFQYILNLSHMMTVPNNAQSFVMVLCPSRSLVSSKTFHNIPLQILSAL